MRSPGTSATWPMRCGRRGWSTAISFRTTCSSAPTGTSRRSTGSLPSTGTPTARIRGWRRTGSSATSSSASTANSAWASGTTRMPSGRSSRASRRPCGYGPSRRNCPPLRRKWPSPRRRRASTGCASGSMVVPCASRWPCGGGTTASTRSSNVGCGPYGERMWTNRTLCFSLIGGGSRGSATLPHRCSTDAGAVRVARAAEPARTPPAVGPT